jgi:dienelactone hydrolase
MRLNTVLALVALFVMSSAATAKIVTQAVPYRHGDVELEGYLAYDDALPGKQPGVLVIHEWWGLNDYARQRARMLAEMGYVAFALDMYGKGKVTTDPKQAGEWATHMRGDQAKWNSRATAGLDVLRAQERCDASRVAAIGYCFGGSTVLSMALKGADLKAVASFHGAIPPATLDDARRMKARALIANGAIDSFIPIDGIHKFCALLDEARVDYQFVNYAGAKHSFTNPGADKFGLPGASYNAAADRRSWAHMKLLFDEALGR